MSPRPVPRIPLLPLLLLLLASAVIAFSGFAFYRHQDRSIRSSVQEELLAVTRLKIEQIVSWQRERLAGCEVISKDTAGNQMVRKFLDNANATSESQRVLRAEVLNRLRSLVEHYDYSNAALVDAKMQIRLAYPPGSAWELGELASESVRKAFAENRIAHSDLHVARVQPQYGNPHFDFAIPLLDRLDSSQPCSVLLLYIKAEKFLFPLIAQWPGQGRSGEILLIRREGSEIIVLNTPRKKTVAPLTLRLPLDRETLPAAKAVRGMEGVFEGVDYAGTPVLSAMGKVPGTPWSLVVKIDKKEVLATVHLQAWFVAILVALLISSLALGAALAWKVRLGRFYRQQYKTERERRAISHRLAELMRQANDPVILLNQESRIIDMNDRALETFGFTREELMELPFFDLHLPTERRLVREEIDKLLSGAETTSFQCTQVRKDGTVFPAECSMHRSRMDDATYFQIVTRDLTNSKEAEIKITALNRLLRTISDLNHLIVHVETSQELFEEACKIIISQGGFLTAWIGQVISRGESVTEVACCGNSEAARLATECSRLSRNCPMKQTICSRQHTIQFLPFEDPDCSEHFSRLYELGVEACGVFPVFLRDDLVALLMVFAESDALLNEESTALLDEMAADMSFAVSALDEAKKRREAEDRVRQEQQKLSAIMESSPICIVMVSKDGTISYANSHSEAVLGIKATDAQGLKYNSPKWQLISADGTRPVPDEELPFPRVMKSREPIVDMRHSIIWPDGRRVILEISGAPLFDSTGEPSGAVFAVEDATKKVEAERAISRSEARFRAMFVRAPIGVFRADSSGNIIEANPALASLLGRDLPTLVGQQITDFLSGNVSSRKSQLVRNLFSSSQSLRGTEVHFLRADGHEIWAHLHTAHVETPDSQPEFIIGMVEDITARKRAEEQLRFDALHDPLTKLSNRALLIDRLQQAIGRLARSPHYLFAVLFLDLDDFKTINDSLGHAVGDQLLVEVARRLNQHLRPGDTLARLGGDEFAVLLEGINGTPDAWQAAERLLNSLRDPFQISGNQIHVSASIGLANGTADGGGPLEFLRDADTAMYSAKKTGKNTVAVFDPSMHAEVVGRLVLERELRRALTEGEFVLHYQPLVDLITGEIVGAEALVRWNHPQRGLTGPFSFIQVAETTGLIVPMGQWILAEACRQTKEWLRHSPELMIHVNVSARQFDDSLLDTVRSILAETGLPPNLLHLEITESLLVSSAPLITELMHRMRDLGVGLCIDDFGTGYSSLAYLSRFPLTGMKLDQSFVNTMTSQPKDMEIVRAVRGLGAEFGLRVYAEGIETEAQREALQNLDYRFGQGYLLGRPVAAVEFEKRLFASVAHGAPSGQV